MTLDDVTLDGVDVTLDELDVTLNGIDMILDFNAHTSSPDAMPTGSPLPHHTSTESPALPGRVSSPTSLVPSTNRPPSQSHGPWTPSHSPSWTIGPQHRPYVRAAAPYLVGVPGGVNWEKLLASYITFESLSADRSVSNLRTEPSIPPADDILGFVETPNKPTPQRTCEVV